MANPNTGRFCWHELVSTDIEKALRFYESLLGWTSTAMPMSEGMTYYILKNGDKQVGGAMKSPPNVPSGWLVYVAVDDCDASAKKITELGGQVMLQPTTVPDMLRFACGMDTQGAAFGIMQGLGPQPPLSETPLPGTFVWDELYVKDQSAAAKFYGALFGWTGKVGEGDPMKYWHWLNGGKDIGGMLTLEQPNVPPHWLGYVAVSDVEGATKKTAELGGEVLMDSMDVPKVGKFSIVQDPTGAAFALFRSSQL